MKDETDGKRDMYSPARVRIYEEGENTHIPLVFDKGRFDKEVLRITEEFNATHSVGEGFYEEPFLSQVAVPLLSAFHFHKRREYTLAFTCMTNVEADDWRIAGVNWLKKRKKNYEYKTAYRGKDSDTVSDHTDERGEDQGGGAGAVRSSDRPTG